MVPNSVSDLGNQHRRRATDVKPSVKTGLNLRNRVGLFPLLSPVLCSEEWFIPVPHCRLPPENRRGWDILDKTGIFLINGVILTFLRVSWLSMGFYRGLEEVLGRN